MPLQENAHLQRARAESFGAIADAYDRHRPSYPPDLIDDLAQLRPGAVLDVGCGTGKAAVLLAARGLDVLGVEPDPAMAAVARTHGLDVEVGHFETWPDRGRRFDLITCAQAWHWVDPVRGAARAAQLLRGRGTLALFWNYDHDVGAAQQAIDDVYEREAPELGRSPGTTGPGRDTRAYAQDLQGSSRFTDVTTRTYRWTRTDSVEDWVGRAATHSDHLALGPARLARLTEAMRTALRDVAELQIHGGTYVVRATVAPQ